MKRNRSPWSAVAALLAVGALAAAVTMGIRAYAPAPRPTTLSVHLAGSAADFQEVNLRVRSVQVRSEATGWVTLGTPDVSVNLLGLTGGVSALLVDDARLAPGAYRQLRLVLGPGASVRLRDGSVFPLATGAAVRDGLQLDVALDVRPHAAGNVLVDLDVARSVRRYDDLLSRGAPPRYVLQPVAHAGEPQAAGAAAPPSLAAGQAPPPG